MSPPKARVIDPAGSGEALVEPVAADRAAPVDDGSDEPQAATVSTAVARIALLQRRDVTTPTSSR
ncbi:hypothetical protein BN13_400010 [Nostocoides jenkinsii Ben 74]|uniref:Uncharacterized protein n=1 Tax=Nostocoides jenkinsii Ben 74 TaxID=1193518 RepID=A0A077MCD2_9MICO|nr:hypothetical protein BN13_400010 [Tetrasphaera jenkinsii Ben 74]